MNLLSSITLSGKKAKWKWNSNSVYILGNFKVIVSESLGVPLLFNACFLTITHKYPRLNMLRCNCKNSFSVLQFWISSVFKPCFLNAKYPYKLCLLQDKAYGKVNSVIGLLGIFTSSKKITDFICTNHSTTEYYPIVCISVINTCMAILPHLVCKGSSAGHWNSIKLSDDPVQLNYMLLSL